MDRVTYLITGAVVSFLIHSGFAHAAEPVSDESVTLTFESNALSETELAAQRGREGLDILAIIGNTNDLDATLSNNVANLTISGNNFIDGGAFSGASGHSTAIQNSGNNNIIQDATIYNFTILP